MDHEAIMRAYPEVVISHSVDGNFDADGKAVSIEQSKVDAARVAIDADKAAVKYKTDRADSFASIGDQLDMQYWDAVNGTTTWKDHVAKVKSDNPKP